MKTLTRRTTYADGQSPDWLKRLSKFLFARYGQPEGYGIAFHMGREIWGSAYRCKDRNRMVCFDHSKSTSGRTETLVMIRSMGGVA